MCAVKIQWRKDYGDIWKTIIGPHPFSKVRDLHNANPTHHYAVYLDGVLNFAWMTNLGMDPMPDIWVGGFEYERKTQ